MARKKKAVDRPPVNVLVSVDEQHRDRLKQVAQRLQQMGMRIAETFPLGGTIAGAVAASDMGKLRAVAGVASVEEEPTFQAF
jgi:hypothetical protein